MVAFVLPDPAAPGSNPGVPDFFQRVDVTEVLLRAVTSRGLIMLIEPI